MLFQRDFLFISNTCSNVRWTTSTLRNYTIGVNDFSALFGYWNDTELYLQHCMAQHIHNYNSYLEKTYTTTAQEPSIYLYKHSMCMYIMLNALNVLHIHGPRFKAH